MNNYALIASIIIGALSGIFGGFFGTSGAAFILPALVVFDVVPNQLVSTGTTLFAILPPISIGAVLTYWKKKEIDFKAAFIIMFFNAIFAYFGSKWAHLVTPKHLRLLLALFYGFMSIWVLYSSLKV